MLTVSSNPLDNRQKYETQSQRIKRAEQQPINFTTESFMFWFLVFIQSFIGADKICLLQMISAIKHFVFICVSNDLLMKHVSKVYTNQLKRMNFRYIKYIQILITTVTKVYTSVLLYIFTSVDLYICTSVNLYVYKSVSLQICRSLHLYVCRSLTSVDL